MPVVVIVVLCPIVANRVSFIATIDDVGMESSAETFITLFFRDYASICIFIGKILVALSDMVTRLMMSSVVIHHRN
jgi:hypothetical protein